MIAFFDGKMREIPEINKGEYPRSMHKCVLVFKGREKGSDLYTKTPKGEWKKIVENSRPFVFHESGLEKDEPFLAFKTDNGLANLVNCKTGKVIYSREFSAIQILGSIVITNDKCLFILQDLEKNSYVVIDENGQNLIDQKKLKEMKWINKHDSLGGMTFLACGDYKGGVGYYVFIKGKCKFLIYDETGKILLSNQAKMDKDGNIHYPAFYSIVAGKEICYDLNGKPFIPDDNSL